MFCLVLQHTLRHTHTHTHTHWTSAELYYIHVWPKWETCAHKVWHLFVLFFILFSWTVKSESLVSSCSSKVYLRIEEKKIINDFLASAIPKCSSLEPAIKVTCHSRITPTKQNQCFVGPSTSLKWSCDPFVVFLDISGHSVLFWFAIKLGYPLTQTGAMWTSSFPRSPHF